MSNVVKTIISQTIFFHYFGFCCCQMCCLELRIFYIFLPEITIIYIHKLASNKLHKSLKLKTVYRCLISNCRSGLENCPASQLFMMSSVIYDLNRVVVGTAWSLTDRQVGSSVHPILLVWWYPGVFHTSRIDERQVMATDDISDRRSADRRRQN